MSDLIRIADTVRLKNAEKRLRVAVIGDVMRDEYVTGDSRRLCPEGDFVPVLSTVGDVYAVPGGAGNTARQLRHWNADVRLLGLLDAETALLCAYHQVDTRHSVLLKTGHNPLKRRFYAGERLLFRQDVEEEDYGEASLAELRQRLLDQLDAALQDGVDVLIISDYDRGCLDWAALAEAQVLCDKYDVWCVADPKLKPPADYDKDTVLKANEAYYLHHLDEGAPDVVTRAAAPPLLFDGRRVMSQCAGRPSRCPARSVVGAGDCFAAHLALATAHGLPLADAAEFAHSVGRAYVQHLHSRPIMPHEAYADMDHVGAKIVSAAEMRTILDVRHPHGKVVVAPGCFDPAHADHARMLAWARQQGDVLVAAVNGDASVARLKGSDRPQLPAAERLHMVAALACVDFVVEFNDDRKLLGLLRPAVLAKGADYRGRDVAAADLADEVRIAPPGVGIHSSVLTV